MLVCVFYYNCWAVWRRSMNKHGSLRPIIGCKDTNHCWHINSHRDECVLQKSAYQTYYHLYAHTQDALRSKYILCVYIYTAVTVIYLQWRCSNQRLHLSHCLHSKFNVNFCYTERKITLIHNANYYFDCKCSLLYCIKCLGNQGISLSLGSTHGGKMYIFSKFCPKITTWNIPSHFCSTVKIHSKHPKIVCSSIIHRGYIFYE